MSDDTDGSSNKLDYALDLMRRLPPRQIESNLVDLTELSPELTDSLLSAIDQPLKIAMDKKVGREYLICEYNRDADSYRSPWSNEYEPPFEDGIYPSASLRKLEIEANAAFEIYRDLYYDGGVSSVYLWDSKQGFAGVVLIKKTGNNASGCWDSIHVVEVNERNRAMSGKIHYKLTSTVMLWLEGNSNAAGKLNLGGSLMRQKEMDTVYDESHSHVANLGRMIEEMENQIRQSLSAVYFDKTKSILNSLRLTSGDKDKAKMDAFRGELMSKMMNRHST